MTNERKIFNLLRQGYSKRKVIKMAKTSDRKIDRLLKIQQSHELSFEQVENMNDEEFELLFVRKKEVTPTQRRPDCAQIHEELKRPNVTLTLLWSEYVEDCIRCGEKYLQYTQFCNLYKEYAKSNNLTMHINRKPGEKCEVDWCGDTLPLYDALKKTIIGKIYVFVGALTYSMFMFARASLDMKIENWIAHHVSMYSYFGAVPYITVCDNCKTAVISHKKYMELIYNHSYIEMADYYNTVVIAARVRAPRDKPAAEGSVGYIERQVLAKLRNERFSSIEEANQKIYELCDVLNVKDFKKRESSREYVYLNEEKQYMYPLPEFPYEYGRWLKAKVQPNYHVSVDKNYYSVPYELVGKELSVRAGISAIEIFYKNDRVATHRSLTGLVGKYSTLEEHMPEKHRQYGEWNSTRFKKWAQNIGPSTFKVVCHIYDSARIEQQVHTRVVSILKLSDKYSKELLEAASREILDRHVTPVYRNFKSLIEHIQVQNELESRESLDDEEFGYIRGADYYGGFSND